MKQQRPAQNDTAQARRFAMSFLDQAALPGKCISHEIEHQHLLFSHQHLSELGKLVAGLDVAYPPYVMRRPATGQLNSVAIGINAAALRAIASAALMTVRSSGLAPRSRRLALFDSRHILRASAIPERLS